MTTHVSAEPRGRYSNRVRDPLDREVLRAMNAGGSETEQRARLFMNVSGQKYNPEFAPLLDKLLKSACSSRYSKIKSDLEMAAAAIEDVTSDGDGQVPKQRSKKGPTVIGITTVDEQGVIEDKSPRQLLLDEVDELEKVLPELAAAEAAEISRLRKIVKSTNADIRRREQRRRRFNALRSKERLDRLRATIEEPGVMMTLPEHLARTDLTLFGFDQEDVSLLQEAAAQ
ncbi:MULTISPECIES: hypothetical protein [Streptomyces]|uniref:hypothetical protein n=1 Tax=Streptomyces TaxID=1883 RepID=UPI001674B1C5|nr:MULTISPECIES: hypothetical protein [Streptomyces]MBK3525438.1 hypothetical protein [Streptomyces sp. MBT70]GGS09471.1 hypothetical protein GCM10010236_74960 [Streptomyces eurythermus]